jgi:hypothetical protein
MALPCAQATGVSHAPVAWPRRYAGFADAGSTRELLVIVALPRAVAIAEQYLVSESSMERASATGSTSP